MGEIGDIDERSMARGMIPEFGRELKMHIVFGTSPFKIGGQSGFGPPTTLSHDNSQWPITVVNPQVKALVR